MGRFGRTPAKNCKKFKFTYADISRLVGKSITAVRMDRSRYRLDFRDLETLVRYILSKNKDLAR